MAQVKISVKNKKTGKKTGASANSANGAGIWIGRNVTNKQITQATKPIKKKK